ncbi:site-specific recombinase XerD [Geomicrobium halophilum]|uniref:Site-specific recombinase XerD n=1 Tax=Geomicrobium halophilum TaxID=549000 RepID=A0A841PNV4_9BACL|nr:site-specific recombinase XerD [Geomicrobium halophilum]
MKSVNTHLRIIKAMFAWLDEEKYIAYNPFQKIKKIKEPQDVVKTITIDQVRRLIKEPDGRITAFVTPFS